MKRSNNKIPFGLKDGDMVDVSEVESGLACGCICPSCHRKLQANKGEVVSHYFSHDPSEDTKACESAFETSIHLMAKQILSEEGSALFPELSVSITLTDINGTSHKETDLVEAESLKRFNLVELERRLDTIRPDIIAYQDSTPFLIEVAVTHFSDKEKIRLIRSKSIPAIEIDLSKVSLATSKEDLRSLIIDKTDNKKWLSHPTAIPIKQQLRAKLAEKINSINEDINRNKQAAAVHYRPRAVLPKKHHPTPAFHLKHTQTKQYDPRWFFCEACRHVFSKPLKEAPYTLDTIQCPECDHAVSTKPY